MGIRIIIPFLSILLALNFCFQLVVSSPHHQMAQIELEMDGDSEEKESKKEKETDKLNFRQKRSAFGLHADEGLTSVHYLKGWISPVIETNDPPPELG